MQCFNCGDDADMEVLMMVNGKMKKINICMDCYQEQLKKMVDAMSDGQGDLDPEEIQRKMFEFFQNNREEFEKFIGEAINDEDFDMNSLNPESFDISEMDFENSGFNLENQDVNNIFKNFNKKRKEDIGSTFRFDQKEFNKHADKIDKEKNSNTKAKLMNLRQMRVLKNAVERKKEQLITQVNDEDYLAAASSRDEIRELNKRIMVIKQLEKEGEVS